MNLIKIRKEIDKLDIKLVKILAQRSSYAIKAGEYKKRRNLKMRQKDREIEIFENLKNKAVEFHLSPQFLEDLFKRIIKESHRIEKEIMSK